MPIPAAVATFALLTQAGALATGEAQGRFSFGEELIEPKHAIAFETRRGDASKPTTTIVLSELPADAEAAVSALDPLTAVINQPSLSDANYVTLSLVPSGVVGMNATFSDGMRQYLASTALGDLKLEWTEKTATRLAGRAYTPAPITTRDGPAYALDVRFDTAVTVRQGGAPLDPDGGEPGRTLLALMAAVASGDLEAIRSHVSAELAADFGASYNTPEENLEWARERLRVSLPPSQGEIRGGTLYPDEAIVELQGEVYEGTRALYRVRLVRLEDRWVFEAGQMAGFLD
jgi:hypothetical protein